MSCNYFPRSWSLSQPDVACFAIRASTSLRRKVVLDHFLKQSILESFGQFVHVHPLSTVCIRVFCDFSGSNPVVDQAVRGSK